MMDDVDATDCDPSAMDALARAASEAPEMNTANASILTEHSILAAIETSNQHIRALELAVGQQALLMSSAVVGSVKKTSHKENIEKSCNKRIFNIETGQSYTCGKTPVVMSHTKQFYCQEHRDLRRIEINTKNRLERLAKQAKLAATKKDSISNSHPSISNSHPSMSVICALSVDGFYLDIFPGSHKSSYYKEKQESGDPIHFSDSERVHIPQTYAILFHKWFYHCGSAVPNNQEEAHCQLRLFSYVTTTFISQDSVSMTTVPPKRLRSHVHKNDTPESSSTFRRPFIMCTSEDDKEWLCKECDEKKVKSREQANDTIVKPKMNSIKPGTIVDGSMERLGYIIFRTSITHEECEYLLVIEKNLGGVWSNIGRKGQQKVPAKTRREQYSIETAPKHYSPLLDIPLLKLRTDISKVDPPISNSGECCKSLQEPKLLRNIGPCAKQYPHSDYKSPF